MKIAAVSILLAFAFVCVKADQLQCSTPEEKIITDPNWTDMKSACTNAVRNQIKTELSASMVYLAMAAHFSRDVINRPGFAHLFFESASEERQHAIKLITYLLMRGELISNVSTLFDDFEASRKTEWESGAAALKDALTREAVVTESIKKLIKVCEEEPAGNDYHIVDYLTGDFLEEQYNGQRDLAGKLSTLKKLHEKHSALGEFLFDKNLLKSE